MKLEMLFIAAGIFGLVFLIGLELYTEGVNKYNVDVNPEDTFGMMSSNIVSLSESSEDMKAKIKGGVVSDENAVDEMISGGYSAIKVNPFNVLSIAGNATSTLLKEINYVPVSVIAFIIFIVSVLTVFAVIYLIFRFRSG